MADLTIIYWRDIPAQVIAKRGREQRQARAAGRVSPRRSTWPRCAAGRATTRATSTNGGAAAPEPCGDDLDAAADAAVDAPRCRVRPGAARPPRRRGRAGGLSMPRVPGRVRACRQAAARRFEARPALLERAACPPPGTALRSARARAVGLRAHCWRGSASTRLERPVAAAERVDQGRAVRLPDVRRSASCRRPACRAR